jgi:iron complex transport system substrate-binding protein
MGETQVAVKPQQVVALHDNVILDPMLALGVKPIGVATYASERGLPFRVVSTDQVAGIEWVGDISQPNLEKILILKPDLILAREFHAGIYKRLSEIAPTVIVPDSLISFKDRFRFIAQVLGRNEEAERVLAQYQARIEEFKRAMGKRLEEIEVSVIEFNESGIMTYGPATTVGEVLKDVGLRRPPAQENLSELTENLQEKTLSLEVIGEHDADVLFLIQYPNVGAESYLNHPVWSQLSAVQNRRVYEVDPKIWSARGPLGANKILDDLSHYLVEDEK